MWFVKKQFISFIEDERIKVLCEISKKGKTFTSEQKEFETIQEFTKYIRKKENEIPQTYISTIIDTFNQGVVNSCSKQKYLEKEIDYDNVKTVCINNKYSFYVSLFDLNKFQKNYIFPVDFIYSHFAVIDYTAKERKNIFYLMVFDTFITLLGYENYIPVYSDIHFFETHYEEIEDIDNIEDIEDIDILDDIDENIEENDIKDMDNIEEKLNNISNGKESEIIDFLKRSLKEYYENYSSDFIEKIIVLDTSGIDQDLVKIIEEELLIESVYKKTDILKILNRMSIESL